MAKVREFRIVPGGLGGEHRETRVRELDKDEKAPDGAQKVADDTPVIDWEPG